ncbi:MAG: M23 family metallopeptidase [Oscillospiraceae bacterium]
MKKFLVGLLVCVLCIPLVLGGILGFFYLNTGADSVPAVALVAGGNTIQPVSYQWQVPVFNGMMHKEFSREGGLQTQDIGVLSEDKLVITYPENFTQQVSLLQNGIEVWNGTGADWNNYTLAANGDYILSVVCAQAQTMGSKPYGSFTFRIGFSLNIEPTLKTSAAAIQQGDVFVIQLSFLQPGTQPTAESDLFISPFVATGENTMCAYLPTSFYTLDGEHTVTVTAGSYSWEVPFTIEWVKFPRQDLEIDTSDPQISEASSQAAYDEYNRTSPPLFDIADSEKYWSGVFLTPVSARISTEYGHRRFTNGSVSSTYHRGIDIAADEGDPVLAPAAGRVLYAAYLLNTGNTLVIEHGGGLKTLYYHMSSLNVTAGAMVERGDTLGAVGTTGYSTGAHLHFDVRIGNQSINPTLALNGSSNLYFFE